MNFVRRLLPLVLGLLLASPAAANTISVGGLTFSDDYGGFNLVSVTGAGTREDPFVIVEEVGKAGNAVLSIEGWKANYYSGEHGGASFWVRKVVINATDKQWGTYELELREELNLPSGYLDGLSFGQPLSESRPAASDRLPEVVVRDEPLDCDDFLRRRCGTGRAGRLRLHRHRHDAGRSGVPDPAAAAGHLAEPHPWGRPLALWSPVAGGARLCHCNELPPGPHFPA